MTQVYHRPGSINKVQEILDDQQPSSILLVRGDKSYASCGAKERIEPQLAGYKVTELSGFSFYPTDTDVSKALTVIQEEEVDLVMAVGGGCVMDVVKAATMLHQEPGLVADYITGKKQLQSGRKIKSLIIPTSTGSGAEITPFAAVYIGGVKYSLEHPSMPPDQVILAPELTYTLPARITAQSGADALANVIEGFWSVKATPESKDYGRQAAPLILDNLAESVNNPCPENRRAMMLGSHLAAKSVAIAKTTAAHALSYPMAAYHRIAHGHGVMLTLPYFFPINERATAENIQAEVSLDYVQKTMRELFDLLGVETGNMAQDMLLALMDKINLEKKLSDFGVQERDLPKIIENGFNPQRMNNNPVIVDKKMVENLLRKIV